MSARQRFVDRMVTFEAAVEDPALVGGLPVDQIKNGKARLFRNGLAVVAFAQLEEFLKSRLAEVTEVIDGSAVKFDDLPERLRSAALVSASHGLSAQLRIRAWGEPERTQMIQRTASDIASSSTATFRISPLLFGAQNANISSEAVSDVLRLFQIGGGWAALEDVAHRVGLGVPALAESFRNFAAARHNAAHDAMADVHLLELQGFRLTAMAIALGFDALLSKACRLLSVGDAALLQGTLSASEVSFRFVRPQGKTWREVREGSSRAVARYTARERAIAGAKSHADVTRDVLVLQDSDGTPREWWTTDVP